VSWLVTRNIYSSFRCIQFSETQLLLLSSSWKRILAQRSPDVLPSCCIRVNNESRVKKVGRQRRGASVTEDDEFGAKSPEQRSVEGEHDFDELAKGLARGTISRGRALKLVGAVVPTFLFAEPVLALTRRQRRRCRAQGRTVCGSGKEQVCCPTGANCVSGSCECPSGEAVCGTACVDKSIDVNNCGSCGNGCSGRRVCENGSCVCPQGMFVCNPDPDSGALPSYCAECGCGSGIECPAGKQCCEGKCIDECPTGQVCCGDVCCPPSYYCCRQIGVLGGSCAPPGSFCGG
jgi:hypothetical protein